MAAAELTETLVGSVAPHEQITGQALKCVIYSATKAVQDDWVILGDFTHVKECVCYKVSTGARAVEAFTIDATTANKVVLTTLSTAVTVSIVAWGY